MSRPSGANLRRSIRHRLPRRRLQPIFERLHGWSLLGMGIGSAVWPFDESGEETLVARIGAWAQDHVGGDGDIVCVDVGANAGVYSGLLVDAIGPRAVVHSFEPAPETFTELQRRVAARPAIHPHQVALGAAEDELTLYVLPGHSQLSSLHPLEESGTITHTVPVRTLDTWAAENGIDQITLVKIDVEGAEAAVLEGASRLLANQRIDLVQFEFGARNQLAGTTLRTFFDLLAGFSIYRILPDGIYRLPAYRGELDIMASATNYLAIRHGISLD